MEDFKNIACTDIKQYIFAHESHFEWYIKASFQDVFFARRWAPSSDHVEHFLSDDDNDGSSSSSSDEEELELCEAALEEAEAEDCDGNDSNGDGKYLSDLWLIFYDSSFIKLTPMVKMTAEILLVKRKTIKIIITLWKNIRPRVMVPMLFGATRLTVNPNRS